MYAFIFTKVYLFAFPSLFVAVFLYSIIFTIYLSEKAEFVKDDREDVRVFLVFLVAYVTYSLN